MHELGLAIRIVDIACSALPADLGGERVEVVNLRVGKLTAVVPESLRFCFEIAGRDTAVAGAKLHIEEVPIELVCSDCHATSVLTEPPFVCADCGGRAVQIVSGKELSVTSIELAERTAGG